MKEKKNKAKSEIKRELLSFYELAFLAGNFKNGKELTVFDLLAKLITPPVAKSFCKEVRPHQQGETFRALEVTDVSYMAGRKRPCLWIEFNVIVDYKDSSKVQYVKGSGLFEFYKLFGIVFANIALSEDGDYFEIQFESHSHEIVKAKVDVEVTSMSIDITETDYNKIIKAIKPIIERIEKQEISACIDDVPDDYFDKFIEDENENSLIEEEITPLFIGTPMEGNVEVVAYIQYDGNGDVLIYILIEQDI